MNYTAAHRLSFNSYKRLVLQVNLYDNTIWGAYCSVQTPWSLYSNSNMANVHYHSYFIYYRIKSNHYASFLYQAMAKCAVFLSDKAHYIWQELGTFTNGKLSPSQYLPVLIIGGADFYQFVLRVHYME